MALASPSLHLELVIKGIYTIKLTLFQHQLDFLGQEEKKKVNRLAKFISLSYVQWFLMSSLSVKAPSEDLLAIHQMKKYAKFDPDVAAAVERVLAGIVGTCLKNSVF